MSDQPLIQAPRPSRTRRNTHGPALRTGSLLAGLLVFGVQSACDGPTVPTPTPAAVEVSVDSVSFDWLGQNTVLQAAVTDASGRVLSPPLTWSSHDVTVATVDGTGRVTAVGNGGTTVAVQAGDARATVAVRVEQRPAQLALSPDSVAFTAIGDTVLLQVSAIDEGGSPLSPPYHGWTSSDDAVVTVDSFGRATAAGAGTALVALEFGGRSASVPVTVRQDVSTVEIRPKSARLTWIGDAATFTATARDANGFPVDGVTIAWQSATMAVASTDSLGTVTARAPGTAVIRATVGAATDTARVTVSPEPAEILLAPSALTLAPGGSATVAAAVRDAGGMPVAGAVVAWSSADADVARVDASGRVTAVAVGSVTVTAAIGGLRATVEVTVELGVPPLTAPEQISAGGESTCALQAGVAYCWGLNTYGQLGTGDLQSQRTPVRVSTSLRFTQISTGPFHTCALTAAGEAYCWGYNTGGQVGDGTTSHRSVPVQVVGGHRFATVETGTNHTCGIKTSGEARCWGWDAFGMLGQGVLQATPVPQPEPGLVSGGLVFAGVALGPFHTCATSASGIAYCWGRGEQYRLGTWNYDDSPTPTYVQTFVGTLPPQPFPAHLTEVAAGSAHGCATAAGGTAACWGSNTDGQLGRDTHGRIVSVAFWVNSGVEFASITASHAYTCGLDASGQAWCWGDNQFGQLGDGTTTPHTLPAPAMPGRTFRQIDAASDHVCGILTSGGWLCWGTNRNGQLGTG